MARALYVEPGLWPLTVLTDGQTAYYGHAGYAVGTIPLALNLVQALGGRPSTDIPQPQLAGCYESTD